MSHVDAIRLVAACAQCEMALVRDDSVAGPLLVQAARAGEATEAEPYLTAAARLARGLNPRDGSPGSRARRKVVQALVRAASTEAGALALRGPRGGPAG